MNIFELVAKLKLDSSEYEQGLEESEKSAGTFGDKLKNVLGNGAKFAAGAIAAAGTASMAAGKQLIEGVSNVAVMGDNIDKMSQKMGMSAEAYQEWDAIMQHSGTSIESLQASMKTISAAAESGSDAFEKLGISQEDVANMSKEDLFSSVITGLQNMEEGTERTYIASQLLGRGATELGALLNTSAEDTEAMRQRVHELGGVMSNDAVKAAAGYQDALQDMQTAMGSMQRGMMEGFLPSFTTIMNGLTAIFSGDSGSGVELVMQGIQAMGEGIEEMIPVIASTMSELVSGLVTLIVNALPGFLDMGFQLIGEMINGISSNLPAIISTVVNLVTNVLTTFLQRLPEFLAMGVQLIGQLISGLVQSIPDILSGIGEILDAAWKAFTDFDWLGLGSDIIDGIVDGILSVGNLIGDTLKGLAKGAWEGLKDFFGIASPSKLMRDSIGKFIPEGIAVGIDANADSVYDAMNDLSNMTVDAYNPQIGYSPVATDGGYSGLYAEVRSLKDAILGMQIVLDTGATVGGLAPAMDAQLGSYSVYKGRGN